MKVVHVREVANVAQGLLLGLQELGHQAELLKPRESTEPRVARKLLLAPQRIADALEINRHIRHRGFDIVHLHYANSGWMGTLGRYRFVLHCHGSDVRANLYHPMHKWLVRYSLKRADLVMFSTPDLYPHIARIRPDATFLPNPIDTRGFADNQAETLGGVRVLINLALNPSKAPQIAFEAAREIKRRCPDVEICAIASGPLYSSFQRYRGVRFLDPVPHAEMAQLINSYDVVLGQFLIGSLGMSELESMACAKPVVCYLDTDLYSRWYGEAPPVVSASTADAAAQSAIKLIQDPLWRQDLGRRGREWVVRHHDYRTVAAQMVDHYHGMLVEAR